MKKLNLKRKKRLSEMVGSRTISRKDWEKAKLRHHLAEKITAKVLKERS